MVNVNLTSGMIERPGKRPLVLTSVYLPSQETSMHNIRIGDLKKFETLFIAGSLHTLLMESAWHVHHYMSNEILSQNPDEKQEIKYSLVEIK